jgi:hypothetical protein
MVSLGSAFVRSMSGGPRVPVEAEDTAQSVGKKCIFVFLLV